MKSQMKEVVSNVHTYFEKLHVKRKSQAPLKRTIEATGIEETTVLSMDEAERRGMSHQLNS